MIKPALAAFIGLSLSALAQAQAGAVGQPAELQEPALQWTLDFPQGVPAQAGEAKPVQLRFYNASGATITLPCAVPQPPGVLVREAADVVAGADGREQWLTLRPIWDAPRCSGGTLTFAADTRGQYRAQFAAPQAGGYILNGFWSGVNNMDGLQAQRELTLP